MKKFLFAVLFTFIIVVFVLPMFFLPFNAIRLKSNVPISLNNIFDKKGIFYELYNSKLPVEIHRGIWRATVYYNEPVIGNIKFLDGEFAITLKGHIINLTKNNKGVNTFADMKSNEWSEEFSELFIALKKSNDLENVKEFLLHNNSPAFYDKEGVLVIMGYGNYNDKIMEYEKVLLMYKNKEKLMKEISLKYSGEAVIRWRKQ